MASRKKKTSPSTNIGCLVLLLGGIVLAVVFAIKFPDIKLALEKTKFLDLIAQKITTTRATNPVPAPAIPPASVTTGGRQVSPSPDGKTPPAANVQNPSKPEPLPSAPGIGRQTSLFFVSISEDGATISSREVKRSVTTADSPLTDAIKALIAGPSEAEIRTGLVSLVPRGTKLKGIVVKGSTAIIDLSDAFMYNRYGSEGFAAQLKQIVYTATSFPSVQDVQILVEGKPRDYLGGEGIYIGKPLSRNSL